jgi:hypothetical protein
LIVSIRRVVDNPEFDGFAIPLPRRAIPSLQKVYKQMV